jgi:tetratricopeptide (TPR) repeat protein
MIPIVALSMLLIMGIYFLINPSYEKSIRAKYYYEIGDYSEALVLSKEAFSINSYNRMASTVMAQSLTSLKYVKYINQAKEYMEVVNKIAQQEFIADSDKARIKLMCEIMVDSYTKLAASVITDKALVDESAMYYKKFEELLEKVTK